jgi:hypothetical protein
VLIGCLSCRLLFVIGSLYDTMVVTALYEKRTDKT